MKARRLPPKAPACDCGAGTARGHRRTCALAMHAMKHGPAPAAPLRASDGLGRESRHQTAKRTERRGLRFPSRLQAEVFEILMARRDKVPGSALIGDPHFPLWRSWREGMGKPLQFSPDFLLLVPRTLRALEPSAIGYDSVQAVEGTDWKEQDVDAFQVEVHEAKTRQGQESRDYVPRLAAWRAEHPTWTVFVWRCAPSKGQPPVCERLADLVAPAKYMAKPLGGA